MTYIPHIHYDKNEVGADYIIGDLHGCYEEFEQVLKDVGFNFETDRMFAVGDLIDRGPKSLECLRLIREPWFFTTIGNHEDMLVKAVEAEGSPDFMWQVNGGDWYYQLGVLDQDEAKFLAHILRRDTPITITLDIDKGKIGICHAEPVRSTFSFVEEATMLWGRSIATHKAGFKMKDVVETYHGHTPLEAATQFGDNIFIDTGACFDDGYLTCIKLQEAPDESVD